MNARAGNGFRWVLSTLLAAGFAALSLAGCEPVEHEGGVFAPFPQGVSSHAVDVPVEGETAPEPAAGGETAGAKPQVVDTGSPPAIVPTGAGAPAAGAPAAGAPAAGVPATANDAHAAATEPVPSVDPTPVAATGPVSAATDPPTAATGVPAGGAPGSWTAATDATAAAAPATTAPTGAGAVVFPSGTAAVPQTTTTAAATAPTTQPVTATPVPATGTPAAGGPAFETHSIPSTAATTWTSGGLPASCGPNALAVSAPLAEIELVAVLPNVTPPSAVVRFPGDTEVVVTVGDMLGLEGAKVVSVGADYLELTELTVGAPDRYTMVKHTLRVAP